LKRKKNWSLPAMRRLHWIFAVISAGAILGPTTECRSQTPYQPTTPTISPWINLFQSRPGPLGNYNSYVRPQMELQDTLQQQGAYIQQQGVGLQTLGRTLWQVEHTVRMRPTGSGSVFMNYSHYYPGAAIGSAAMGSGPGTLPLASPMGGGGAMPGMPGQMPGQMPGMPAAPAMPALPGTPGMGMR
jgi:hypothetical protein